MNYSADWSVEKSPGTHQRVAHHVPQQFAWIICPCLQRARPLLQKFESIYIYIYTGKPWNGEQFIRVVHIKMKWCRWCLPKSSELLGIPQLHQIGIFLAQVVEELMRISLVWSWRMTWNHTRSAGLEYLGPLPSQTMEHSWVMIICSLFYNHI